MSQGYPQSKLWKQPLRQVHGHPQTHSLPAEILDPGGQGLAGGKLCQAGGGRQISSVWLSGLKKVVLGVLPRWGTSGLNTSMSPLAHLPSVNEPTSDFRQD